MNYQWDNAILSQKLKENPDLSVVIDKSLARNAVSGATDGTTPAGGSKRRKGKQGHPEQDFQQQIIDLAHLHGWKVAHFRPAMKKDGTWVTPVSADGKGFPDLFMVNPGHRPPAIVFEVKSKKGALPSPEQYDWIMRIRDSGIVVELVTPGDWDKIVLLLA